MANMRVHELAKELNITSKDITDMLSNSEKTYKSVSGLTDAEISSVRKKFAPAPKAENKPAAQPAKQSQPVKNDNRDNRQQNPWCSSTLIKDRECSGRRSVCPFRPRQSHPPA